MTLPRQSRPRQSKQSASPAFSRRDLLLGRRHPAAKNSTPAQNPEGRLTPEQSLAEVGPACFMARGIACRLCEDSCDSAAFRFRPQLGGRTAVSVEAANCTGCADCIDLCPADAISLIAVPIQTTADHQPNQGGTPNGR